jgi:hypothetical protein
MKKDGPPISSGYRYGGRAAFQAYLPASALSPKIDMEAGETLAAFIDYHGRARGIGQLAPETQGVSEERAAVLERIQELQEAKPDQRRITFLDTPERKIELVPWKYGFFLVERNRSLNITRVSRSYGNSAQAKYAYRNGILWQKTFPLKEEV